MQDGDLDMLWGTRDMLGMLGPVLPIEGGKSREELPIGTFTV